MNYVSAIMHFWDATIDLGMMMRGTSLRQFRDGILCFVAGWSIPS